MKQAVYIFCLLVAAIIASRFDGQAQIIGKIYQIGDTIHLDGYHGLVIQVDETGLHGLALSHAASNFDKKTSENYQKRLDKLLKKKQITEDEYQLMLNDYNSQKVVSPVPTQDLNKGQRLFKIDEFEENMGNGWHVPSTADIQAINQFMVDITDNRTMDFMLKPSFQKNNNLPYEWRETFFEMKLNGFIAQSDNSAVFATKQMEKTLHFVTKNKWWNNLSTIAVKNF